MVVPLTPPPLMLMQLLLRRLLVLQLLRLLQHDCHCGYANPSAMRLLQ